MSFLFCVTGFYYEAVQVVSYVTPCSHVVFISIRFSCICLFILHAFFFCQLFVFLFGSRGRALACDCGTPLTCQLTWYLFCVYFGHVDLSYIDYIYCRRPFHQMRHKSICLLSARLINGHLNTVLRILFTNNYLIRISVVQIIVYISMDKTHIFDKTSMQSLLH